MMDLKVLAVVTVFVVVMISREAETRPSYQNGWVQYRSRLSPREAHRRAVNECENSHEVRELCQRCAKVTKSRLAYPMCCEMRENTRSWCTKFLNFGLSSNNVDSVDQH